MHSPFSFFSFFLLLFSLEGNSQVSGFKWEKITRGSADTGKLDSLAEIFHKKIDSLWQNTEAIGGITGTIDSLSGYDYFPGHSLLTFTEKDIKESEVFAVCYCSERNDSVYVQMNAGFFGGSGIEIVIHNGNFSSAYYEYTDDLKIYARNKNDTGLLGNISVPNTNQQLMLEKGKPGKNKLQLAGELQAESGEFFSLAYDPALKKEILRPRKVMLNAKFKCGIKKIQ